MSGAGMLGAEVLLGVLVGSRRCLLGVCRRYARYSDARAKHEHSRGLRLQSLSKVPRCYLPVVVYL